MNHGIAGGLPSCAVRRAGVWFCAALALGIAFTAAPGHAAEMVPHRALYSMTLASADSTSGVIGARGAMQYRFADGCDGWTVETRTYLRIAYDHGSEVESTWSFITWESKDGLRYRFRINQARDGRTIEDTRGEAELEARDGPGVVWYTKPEREAVDLPAGTLFPTDHLARMLAAATAGEKRFVRPMYDGSGEEGPDLLSAVIAPIAPAERPGQAKAAGLAPSPAWHIRLAFFPQDAKDAAPVFEIGVRYRADGIAEWVEQDFGDFILDLQPTEIEILDPPVC
jgi:hypothetical protein